ncbi:MAG: hypothetical protein HEP71_02250 [Roseivirga sp.]|nr:hypothetical protein [Roseivirga sp.]
MNISNKPSLCILSTMLLLMAAGCSLSPQRESNGLDYLDQLPPGDTPRIFAPGIVSMAGRFDMGFTMSANGSTIAFGIVHENDPAQTNIQFLTRKNGIWTGPNSTILPDNINTSLPMFGPRGREFYYTKSINGAENDLWVGNYSPKRITNNRQLNQTVNSTKREAGHGKTLEGTLYFTSNRDDTRQCCGDIYRAALTDNYTSAERVYALNSEADEDGLFMSPNEDYIIIQAWKNEFQTKHDLYISYRTSQGNWTTPERLGSTINGPEIEQRPFVSPDNRYLFFSRMSTEQKGNKTIYESDIYWVNTQTIFKPYLYNPINTFRVNSAEFSTRLPEDLFKDVDDAMLSYTAALANGKGLPEQIDFDPDQLIISGSLGQQKSLALTIKARDHYGNTASVHIELISQ